MAYWKCSTEASKDSMVIMFFDRYQAAHVEELARGQRARR